MLLTYIHTHIYEQMRKNICEKTIILKTFDKIKCSDASKQSTRKNSNNYLPLIPLLICNW